MAWTSRVSGVNLAVRSLADRGLAPLRSFMLASEQPTMPPPRKNQLMLTSRTRSLSAIRLRKKKCIRYKECGDDGTASEDNLGSVDSVGDSRASPDCDGESYQQSSGSSPGGLSGLSSLTSPGLLASPGGSLHSPSVSLASPSLQSPLTPGDYDIKPPRPVGANPHDVNNPLSVNQLTGKCIKAGSPPHHQPTPAKEARTVISVP